MEMGKDGLTAQTVKGVLHMSYQQILDSFMAFNINSINSLIYTVKSNLWLILTIVGALTIIILNIREEIEDYVTEEQNII